MKFWLLFLPALFLYSGIRAQYPVDRDSLGQLIRNASPDSTKVKLMIQLGQHLESNNPDSALKIYEQSYALSKKLNYTRGIISYYTNATYVYNMKGMYDTALTLNLQSVEIARTFGNQERLAACLGNTAVSYMLTEQYEKAIEYFMMVTPFYEKLQDGVKLTWLYDNLSVLYDNIGQYTKAIEMAEKALLLGRKSENPMTIVSSLVNLSKAHNSLGQAQTAIKLLKEAETLAKKEDNQFALISIYLNLSNANIKLYRLEGIKENCEKALALARKLGDRESEVIAMRGLGIYHLNKGSLAVAETYARQSLSLAETSNMPNHIAKGFSLLGEISIAKKDFRSNHFYSRKEDSISTVLFNASLSRNIQNVEARYQSEQKQEQIKHLQRESAIKDLSIAKNRLAIILLAICIAFIILLSILSRLSLLQRRKILETKDKLNQMRIDELEKERQLLASEGVIKGQEQERARLARDLHDGLGGLLSGVKFAVAKLKASFSVDRESDMVFDRSLDMLDHSLIELRRIAHNMMPELLVTFGLNEALKSYCESLRQSGVFNITYQWVGLEDRLPPKNEIFLYRIVQELLGNAARHSGATEVLVQVSQEEKQVAITVEDNGKGFDASIKHPNGAGWSNIHSRTSYLHGSVDVQSRPGTGTSILITIPRT